MSVLRNTHKATPYHMRVALREENPEGTYSIYILTGKEVHVTAALARDGRTLSL